MERLNVSVLLLTLNEEANLPRCLSALDWCDDIVVLDSFSSDRTSEIASAAGARVLARKFDDFAGQRNYALETVEFRHDWILHLDADEVVTAQLVEGLSRITSEGVLDAYRLPSKIILWGRWLRHSGMYPTYQVRLTRRGAFRFRQVGHGQKEDIDGTRVGTLGVPYLHYAFSRGMHEWFDKHNRYSLDEARDVVGREGRSSIRWTDAFAADPYRRRQMLRRLSQELPGGPLLRFLYMYVLRGGFLEGRAGLTYCLLLSVYEFMISVKVQELRRNQKNS